MKEKETPADLFGWTLIVVDHTSTVVDHTTSCIFFGSVEDSSKSRFLLFIGLK